MLAVLGYPSPAYAYVDPGAGSMLLQLLLGGIVGLLFFARLFRGDSSTIRLCEG